MRCQRAVGVAALGANCFFLAGGSAAGVGFLLADGIPNVLYIDALCLKLGLEILHGLAAALTAEPVILIVAAMVDVPDMQVFENIVNGYRAL